MKYLFLIIVFSLTLFTLEGFAKEKNINKAFGIEFGKKIPSSILRKNCDSIESYEMWWGTFAVEQCFDFIPTETINGMNFEKYNFIVNPTTQEVLIINAYIPFSFIFGPDSEDFIKCMNIADKLINILYQQYGVNYKTENLIPEGGGNYHHLMTFGENIFESSNILVICDYPYSYEGLQLSYVYIP